MTIDKKKKSCYLCEEPIFNRGNNAYYCITCSTALRSAYELFNNEVKKKRDRDRTFKRNNG